MVARARILDGIRTFFRKRNYLEVDTPLLSPSLIPESTIEAFRTDFVHPFLPARDLYLIPSPELWMKQLIGEGSGDIFQICHAFRNAENIGDQHSPEFTMLEWYTLGADYRQSIQICQSLIATLADAELSHSDTSARERLEPLTRPFRVMTMQEAFERFADFDLANCTDRILLENQARRLGLSPSTEDSWQELFNRIFLTFVEQKIAEGPPTILTDFPSGIATLARAIPGTPWSERWELYLDGRETANCYTEETDPQRMVAFFERESLERSGSLVPVRPALDFPRLFVPALPACSGVALGVDRLIMALTGASSIRGVIFFPVHDTLQP